MKRIHIHVGVTGLEQSVGFYTALFGQDPTVLKDDYAKWMLDDPRVNFAISEGHGNAGVEHLGIQTESDAELDELRERLAQAEAQTVDQHETTCCYAVSNKTWARDPQGVAWETFHTMTEAKTYGQTPEAAQAEPAPQQGTSRCC